MISTPSATSMVLSESSTFDRSCIIRTRTYRAMIVTLTCALDLVEQVSKTDITKPEIDGYHAWNHQEKNGKSL